MKSQTWVVRAAFGLVIWAGMGLGAACAGAISPVDTTTGQLLNPADIKFRVSVFNAVTFADITDSWLPEWRPPAAGLPIINGGTPVYVVFNDLSGVSITPTSLVLIPPTAAQASAAAFTGTTNPFFSPLSTTAYPGQCTNFGSPTDFSMDFAFSTTGVGFTATTGSKTGFLLTPLDCGGMAVISATATVSSGTFTHTLILPESSGGLNSTTRISGIPDIWAGTFCSATNPCPTGREDADASAGSTVTGDGISAFDEYRGFIVSGTHIRTDPRQKDLFVHLVNPQCGTSSLLVGATFASGIPLFTNLNTLISGTQIHTLGYVPGGTNLSPMNEWVDNFHHYSVTDGVRFGDGNLTTAPAGDRWVTPNRIYTTDSLGNPLPTQKGLRIIECLDVSALTPLGLASLGSPNGPDNSIIFTQRIVNYLIGTLGATCTTVPCLYSTFQSGAWTTPVAINFTDLIARATEFYLAMEIGHSIQLTPTVEGTSRTSYGYHHAPGTGSNLDQAITNKLSTKGGTNNIFYIPMLYNATDLQNYKLK